MALASITLNSSPTLIYGSIGTTAVTVIYICNSGVNATNFYIYAVPSGSLPSFDNSIYFNVTLTPNDTYVIDTEKMILENGDQLFANISTPVLVGTKIVATVSSIGV